MFTNTLRTSSFPTRPTSILDPNNLQPMSKTVHFAPYPTIMDSPESVTSDDDSSSQEDIPCSPVIPGRRTKQELDAMIENLFGTDAATTTNITTTNEEKKKEKGHEQGIASSNHNKGYINNKSKRKWDDTKDIKAPNDEATIKKKGILAKKSTSIQPAMKPARRVSPADLEKREVAVWTGYVELSRRIRFQATARQIGGRKLSMSEWSHVLSPTLWVEGRIHVDVVDDYVTKIQHTPAARHEIVLVLFEPTQATTDNGHEADTLKEYLDSRRRLGVIGHNMTSVKDFYLMPLSEYQQLPDFLYVVRMDEVDIKRQGNVYIGIIVIQKPAPLPLPLPSSSSSSLHRSPPSSSQA
ncbi:hypothetical protein O0I10_004071 [Lichtheimia ornata]|uniref:Spen paralogue and orthologue SPOC C-terminal domain-containing protein n=1 Tax=Lichtheimia ornata TaxID=688661 RepID=A0AAD7V836_9FUNG|nr:uncharacterized protein O0I10_004071 [Lichtheimia ornata]KAJ8660211.1 hypothetical protein O0I10_004071 [Lichtheimia ornata]